MVIFSNVKNEERMCENSGICLAHWKRNVGKILRKEYLKKEENNL